MADTAREASSSPGTASQHDQHPEKGTAQSSQTAASDTSSSRSEPRPHLHAKTFLAVFAICVIYFVQIYNVVGSGAVSADPHLPCPETSRHASSSALTSTCLNTANEHYRHHTR